MERGEGKRIKMKEGREQWKERSEGGIWKERKGRESNAASENEDGIKDEATGGRNGQGERD